MSNYCADLDKRARLRRGANQPPWKWSWPFFPLTKLYFCHKVDCIFLSTSDAGAQKKRSAFVYETVFVGKTSPLRYQNANNATNALICQSIQ